MAILIIILYFALFFLDFTLSFTQCFPLLFVFPFILCVKITNCEFNVEQNKIVLQTHLSHLVTDNYILSFLSGLSNFAQVYRSSITQTLQFMISYNGSQLQTNVCHTPSVCQHTCSKIVIQLDCDLVKGSTLPFRVLGSCLAWQIHKRQAQ